MAWQLGALLARPPVVLIALSKPSVAMPDLAQALAQLPACSLVLDRAHVISGESAGEAGILRAPALLAGGGGAVA